MKLRGVPYHPYRTLYEQYLEYPTIIWPPQLTVEGKYQILPNGTAPLNNFPISVQQFYMDWLDVSAESDREYVKATGPGGAHNVLQLRFQFISETLLFNRQMPQYFILPAMVKTLCNTKLTFSGTHLATALTKTGPYILNIPDQMIQLPDGTYISSVLVDFQSTTSLGMPGPPQYFLVLHYWQSPLPKNRHPGECKTDTSIILIGPDQSLEDIFQEFERTLKTRPKSADTDLEKEISRNFGPVVKHDLGMQMDIARQFYALVVGSCILISSSSEFITPLQLPIRKIEPKVLVPTKDQKHWISYPNNASCPCDGEERETFRNHCKKRLRDEQGILANKNYLIGEEFQEQARERELQGIAVPPHLQIYWPTTLPTGEKVAPYPRLQQAKAYAYTRERETTPPAEDPWQAIRKRRYQHKRLAKKMREGYQPPQLEPVFYGEAEPVETQLRDTAMVRWLKSVYDHTCQMCGYRITLPDGRGYSIGAHIMPFSEFPHLDIPENILILCPTHHDEFDLGIIWVETDLFYWIRQERMKALEIDPTNPELHVPTEYVEGFIIQHQHGDSTVYSREVHGKTLKVIPPGSPRLPQGHCLNPFYFQYRFRKHPELETELGEMYRLPKISGPKPRHHY